MEEAEQSGLADATRILKINTNRNNVYEQIEASQGGEMKNADECR